jgi:hypothetical protein
MIMISGPRVVGVLENSDNLIFGRSSRAETSLVVREDVLDLKVILDTAGGQGFKNF